MNIFGTDISPLSAFAFIYIFASVVFIPVVRHYYSPRYGYLLPLGMIATSAILIGFLKEAGADAEVLSGILTNASLIIWSAVLGALVLKTDKLDEPANTDSEDNPDSKDTPYESGKPANANEQASGNTMSENVDSLEPLPYSKTQPPLCFTCLLKKFREERSAYTGASYSWKPLLPLLVLLLPALVILLLGWCGAEWAPNVLVFIAVIFYLYGLWVLVRPLRTSFDPLPELMHELDNRFELGGMLHDDLQKIPLKQRKIMLAHLARYKRRISALSRLFQFAFILLPFFAFLLELVIQGWLSNIEHGSLLLLTTLLAVLTVILIGIIQMRRALEEIESLQSTVQPGRDIH